MRCDVQLVAVRAPRDSPAKGQLEPGKDPHDDCVGILCVKTRVFENSLVRSIRVRIGVVLIKP